ERDHVWLALAQARFDPRLGSRAPDRSVGTSAEVPQVLAVDIEIVLVVDTVGDEANDRPLPVGENHYALPIPGDSVIAGEALILLARHMRRADLLLPKFVALREEIRRRSPLHPMGFVQGELAREARPKGSPCC